MKLSLSYVIVVVTSVNYNYWALYHLSVIAILVYIEHDCGYEKSCNKVHFVAFD